MSVCCMMSCLCCSDLTVLRIVFFFNDTATTEIYTLSLHDALPIFYLAGTSVCTMLIVSALRRRVTQLVAASQNEARTEDRKSTRLNSSHANISYAVFCLKKKKKCHMSLNLN